MSQYILTIFRFTFIWSRKLCDIQKHSKNIKACVITPRLRNKILVTTEFLCNNFFPVSLYSFFFFNHSG